MSTEINHFKLGLFTLCGLAILISGILAFGARSYFEPTSLFETYVEGDVTGLAVGSAVELRGVRVGKVRRINFSWSEYQQTTPSYVVVEFEMRNDVTPLPPGEARSEMLQSAIKRGLRARLKSQGITGTSFLSLEYLNPADNPPAQVPWTPKHTYIPAAPGQLGELLASIDKTLRNVAQLDFNNIDKLVQNDLKSVGQLLDKAGQIDFGSLGTNANSLLVESKETVAQLKPALTSIDFNALNQTLANAQRTVHDLDDVLAELKNYPSGFLFGSPPPPVKEVQPSAKK
ncbi:MAG TPA: MlaD family protein [Candidatus Sulfotelmatobacter sp.]|jgi:ABC-type transporter Mla subunit MlaD|nr:MlaD family protein [Candidatus Sulfotelmatobacter sp.]